MARYIDKSALVAEIKRRLWLLVPKMTFHQQRVELEKLLSFINTLKAKDLQEEPVSKDVEQEIEKYFANWLQGASDEGCFNANSELVSIYDCHRIARHFAKWQKEQMIKDAFDAELDDVCGFLTISVPYHNGIAGDKVKVIIIKSE